MNKKPVVLVVMDGVGKTEKDLGNMVMHAHTPTLDEMMAADEVFFSSSSALTCRVCEIDGKAVGMKDEKTFSAIRDAYQALLDKEYRA